MISKRALFILLPLVVSVSSAVALYFYVKPKIQSWLLNEVQFISNQKLPVQLKIEKIDWTLLFPSVQVYGVNVSSKENVESNSVWNIPPARIEKIEATLDLLRLIAGRLMISSLVISEPKLEIDLDPYLKDNSNKEPLPLKQLFELTNKFPLTRFGIDSAHILLKSKKLKASLQLNASDLLIRNRQDKLILQLDLKDSVLNIEKNTLSAHQKNEFLPVPFRIQGEALMTENILDISSLKIGVFRSTLNLKGNLSNLAMIHLKPEGTLDYELFLQLQPLSQVIEQYMALPNLDGEIKSSGRLTLDNHEMLTSGFKFQAEKLKVTQFNIGDLQFQAQIKNDELTIPTARLSNEAGLLDIKNISIAKNSENNWQLRSELASKMIDLNQLLSGLGLTSVPVEAFIGAKLNCKGPLWPELAVNCAGDSQIDQVEVRSGNNVHDIIVMLDQGKLHGDFNIKKTAIDFKTEITMGKDDNASKGFSSGEIIYAKGFNIKFDSDHFDLSNIKHLAGLKLEGAGAVHGSTTGNSAAATFEMLLDTQNVFFENFSLGNVSGILEYDKGIMNFSNLNGKINNSTYQGQVVVDLNQKHIKSQIEIPRFEINELLSVVSRRFIMPVEVSGLGRAKINVDGPFQLGKLSYQLNAQMSHGSVVSEPFDILDIKLESNSGEMHIEKLQMTKNQSLLNMTGISHPDGQIDLKIIGNSLPLEESENVRKLGSQISGMLDVETLLKGFILNPDVHVSGKIYDLSVEEQEFTDSQFQLTINQEQIKGDVELFGNQVKSTFQLPISEKTPFALKIQANQWNYTTLATLIGGGKLLNDYQSSLTGDLDLHADSGGLWKSTGRGHY
jgi:translocation and assembly module TamB